MGVIFFLVFALVASGVSYLAIAGKRAIQNIVQFGRDASLREQAFSAAHRAHRVR